jgi:thymidylate synthase (FAD)
MSPGERVHVLDAGEVAYIGHLGSDLTVVNAARVSFLKRSDVMLEREHRLIEFLARNGHWTPFAHCQVTLSFKMPLFVRAQWYRSNVGITYWGDDDLPETYEGDGVPNEVSRRYVDDVPQFYKPALWRGRPPGSMKQGSGEAVAYKTSDFSEEYATAEYQRRLAGGVAPEMARACLPQNLYTEFWMTASLAAYARVFRLRSDPHAQWEARQYASALATFLSVLYPVSWCALALTATSGEPR